MNKAKLKKWLIIANLSLVGLALPLSLVSGWLSANLLANPGFEPVRTLQATTPLNLEVYDNFSPAMKPKRKSSSPCIPLI
jgi:hypothetical protein